MGSDEEEMQKIEEEIKRLEESSSDYGSPTQEKKDTILKFFREILYLKDNTKVGNLSQTEIGTTRVPLRSYQQIALYAEAEGLDKVATYLRGKGDIIPATSMSLKGFLAQLFVTQIKKEQKLKEPEKQKKGWFFKKKEEEENE